MDLSEQIMCAKEKDILRLSKWLGFRTTSAYQAATLINSVVGVDLQLLLELGFLEPIRQTQDGKIIEYKLTSFGIQLLQNNIDNSLDIEE